MRKSKKSELYNCIHTLMSAHRKMDMANADVRVEILPQCQEMAIMVGNTIDQIEGEGTVAVSFLEEYCETLYESSLAHDQTGWKVCNKKMEKLLKSIEHSIRYDLPDSPAEIVFMPYKASMWDALDSVYRAAIQEENCHVIVMPIPYYNANRKDQRVDLYYEGNLFSEDISITDYRAYDLEKEHPDVIFIHNPYDNYNYVTQVPREYFSSELMKHTDHLIYIPYFITKGDEVKDEYCVMPAVHNAWRTFVQSEAVRKCYLRNGADPDKIVAVGSPKFDMVIKMQKNPPKMPVEWKKALNGRKIFLLNTHLNPIINEAEKQLDKLHQIFELFRHREDAALLWRPHPLSIETAKAMNPQMLDNYLHTIDEFKTLPNGVYDETPDVHRAIAISDAYVGNWSSLVTLYGITGKPMYLFTSNSDTKICVREQAYRLHFSCGLVVDGVLWASAETHNGLYKIDLETGIAQLICRFNDENTVGVKQLYKKIVHYDNKLYMIPWLAKSIAVYSLESGEMEYITPDYSRICGSPRFGEAMQYKEYLYLFPARITGIVRINLVTKEMEYYTECCRQLMEVGGINTFFVNGTFAYDKAWVASAKTNCFVEFFMREHTYQIHFIGSENTPILDVAIADDGYRVYILNIEDEVFEWDRRQDKVRRIWKNPDFADVCGYGRIVWLDDCLWLVPVRENKVVKLHYTNPDNYEISEIMLPDNCYDDTNLYIRRLINYSLQDGKILVYPSCMNFAYIINCDENVIETKEIVTENPYEYDAQLEWYITNSEKDNIISESFLPLEYFVNARIADKINDSKKTEFEFKKMQSNTDGFCGNKIWKYVSKALQI